MFFSKKKIPIDTSDETVEKIISRGVEKNFPSDDFLRTKLKSGEQQKIYLGIDPTGPTLHMGHMVVLRKLSQLQKAGHKIILLIGDFTATIGDPDKSSVRKPLTRQQVLENQKLYKDQASLILNFKGENPAEFIYNSKWLEAMNFEDVLKLSSTTTVQQMMERDIFKKRMEERKPIYIHEFMYPLMVAQDSLSMDVDGEVGGNDQTFNMLMGRHLQKEIQNKEKFVIPMKLLIDNSGSKMGKTTGNMLSFLDSAFEKFGKIMSWTDEMILLGFELLTDENLDKIQIRLNSDENPKNIKIDLALSVVSIYHSKGDAEKARMNWDTQFSKKEIPSNLETFSFNQGIKILDILKDSNISSSNKESKRKIDEGAVYVNGKKVLNPYHELEDGESILKLGKKMVIINIK